MNLPFFPRSDHFQTFGSLLGKANRPSSSSSPNVSRWCKKHTNNSNSASWKATLLSTHFQRPDRGGFWRRLRKLICDPFTELSPLTKLVSLSFLNKREILFPPLPTPEIRIFEGFNVQFYEPPAKLVILLIDQLLSNFLILKCYGASESLPLTNSILPAQLLLKRDREQ
jgi:hypothetical protein